MNHTTTTNGAITNTTSGKECLDLFQRIGNMRYEDRLRILEDFDKAYKDDKELATQVLFWARAAREGSGERKTFHTILQEIGKTSPDFISDNAKVIAELGYWKDLLPYLHIDNVVSVFAQAIRDKDRLACKWAPRKCAVLRDELNMTNKEYRKWLSEHSETVEQKMSEKDWDEINYSSVPGSAMRRYGKAFDKRDHSRFEEWKKDKNSKASVSASYPHEIIKLGMNEFMAVKHDADWDLIQKMWDSLEDFVTEGENILPMIDTSGSMNGLPIKVAISLGLYLAERNKEGFEDTFLTFSERPELLKVSKGYLKDKFTKILQANWGMNTNFEKAYSLILDTAISFNVSQEDMPSMLLVLSDMQFDASQRGRNRPHFDLIKKEFKQAGYEMPKLVFWNLRDSICSGSPAQSDSNGVAMVSGFSPSIMESLLRCEDFDPISIMMESLKEIEVDCTNLPDSLDVDYQKELTWEEEFNW